jgi:membrane protease subunit (stomatin/prohibitin family)
MNWQKTVIDLDKYLNEMGWVLTKDGLQYTWLELMRNRQAEATWKARDPEIEETKRTVDFMWQMIKYCPNCGCYLPKNLNETRIHTCQNCGWSGESLKFKYL